MALSHLQITPDFLRGVRDAVDIVAIASDHTRLRKAGRRWSGLCPLHKEKTPSFSVDPEQGLFYCFGCGAGGDGIRLHMALSGDDFPAAVEALARRFGVPIPAAGPARRTRGEEGPDLEPVLAAAEEFFRGELARSEPARSYLARRRVPAELVARFGLGYAPDGWRSLLGALSPRFPVADLLAAGLVTRPEGGGDPYDRFRHRLVFPIRDAAGRLVGFGGRTLGDDKAKYLNTAETVRFHKSSLLYGLDQAKRAAREGGRLVLVEGYFDLLAVAAAGEPAVVASMGTALTPEQVRLLARWAEEVAVAYDGDSAGAAAAERALPLLLAERLTVRRARLPAGQDPDSLRLAAGEEALAALLAEAPDFVLLELERLVPADAHRQPHLQARAAAGVTALLAPIPDPVLRYGYGRLAADRLRVPAELLWGRLGVDREGLKPTPAVPRREVASLDEEVLWLLLRPGGEGLEGAELPVPEVFFDLPCRNIYAVYRALYERDGAPPALGEVLAAVAAAGPEVDRLARLLLEREDSPGATGPMGRLRGCLDKLNRRWQKQRLRELANEIHEAARQGDPARLDALLGERDRLNRALHSLQPPNQGTGPA